MTEQIYSVDRLLEAVESVENTVYVRNSTVKERDNSVTLSWTDRDGAINREITLHTDGTPIECVGWIPEGEATDNNVYLGMFEDSDDIGVYSTSREVHIENEGMLNDIAGEAAIVAKNLP